MLSKEELVPYARLYDDIMSGAVDASNHRHDLGSHLERTGGRRENICQVMWPSLYLSGELEESVLHTRVIDLARQLLGRRTILRGKSFIQIIIKKFQNRAFNYNRTF